MLAPGRSATLGGLWPVLHPKRTRAHHQVQQARCHRRHPRERLFRLKSNYEYLKMMTVCLNRSIMRTEPTRFWTCTYLRGSLLVLPCSFIYHITVLNSTTILETVLCSGVLYGGVGAQKRQVGALVAPKLTLTIDVHVFLDSPSRFRCLIN